MGAKELSHEAPQGRGTGAQPANRFDRLHVDIEPDAGQDVLDEDARDRTVPTEFFRDHSRSIISTNDSPDVPFSASLNPYRGCEHARLHQAKNSSTFSDEMPTLITSLFRYTCRTTRSPARWLHSTS